MNSKILVETQTTIHFCTLWSHYDVVNLLQNLHNRCPIPCPLRGKWDIFVGSTSDLYSAPVTALIYAISHRGLSSNAL